MVAPQSTPERVTPLLRAEDVRARLRAEDLRTRRLVLWLTLVPVAVGLLVMAMALRSVRKAQQRRDALGAEVARLEAVKEERNLEIDALQQQKAQLVADIEARKKVFAEFQGKLPVDARQQASAIESGLEQMQRGDYAQAVSSYRRVTREQPHNSLALGLEGSAQLKAGNVEAAVETLRRAVAADPGNANARYELAIALATSGRAEDAVRESDEAFRIDAMLEGRSVSDRDFVPVRRLREARRGAQSAASEPEKAHVSAGLSAAHAGQLEAAIKEYELALQINPRNADVLNWRGYALYRLGRFDEARESLQRAVALRRDHAEAHYNLGLTLWRLGRQADAGEELKRAFALDPRLREAARGDYRSRPIVQFMSERR